MNQENIFDLPSVLIVDDNVKNLQILGGFLQNEKLIVEFAIDGMSALNWLDKKKFDLILLDIMMPGLDGYEVCSLIKKNPAISEIPIIFITAKTDSESIIKGFETGAVDYITKPFIQSELLVRVKTQLNIKKANEQINHYLKEIEDRNKNISDSIDYARYIQDAVLNTSEKNLKFLLEYFILNLPKDILSGDFYWLCEKDNKIIIAVMDCTGHGVPGALMSILGITLLNEIVLHDHIIQPDKILESLRSKIINALSQKKGYGHIKDGIEGSVICFDTESKKLLYSGAFNPLILIHADEIFDIKADRIPIGYYEINGNFTLHEIDIEKNDTIYLFSDGIIDQFGGPKTKRFMLKHLKKILLGNHNKTMIRQKEILIEEFNRWKGDLVQTDDILVLGIRL
ncbi:MAG TPA: response regulator [Bacteroidales bacterium]|nr:response regulator [Bacteroidales bacterium]